jgi:hypothetical protein
MINPVRNTILSLAAIALYAMTAGMPGASSAQARQLQTPDEIAHERLEVFEPFIGTWRLSGTNGDNQWGWEMTWAWAYPETMIFGDAWFEMSGPDMETVSAPWARASMSWNPVSEAVEYTFIDLGTGFVEVFEIEPQNNGRFVQTLIRSTDPTVSEKEIELTITDTGIVVRQIGVPDSVQTLSRVNLNNP